MGFPVTTNKWFLALMVSLSSDLSLFLDSMVVRNKRCEEMNDVRGQGRTLEISDSADLNWQTNLRALWLATTTTLLTHTLTFLFLINNWYLLQRYVTIKEEPRVEKYYRLRSC